MKLPIIEAIVNGKLHPNNLFWVNCEAENGYINTERIIYTFARLPYNIEALKKHYESYLFRYLDKDFTDNPFNDGQEAEDDIKEYESALFPDEDTNQYTPITKEELPIDFDTLEFTFISEMGKFYQYLVETERKRIQLALLAYSQARQSDHYTRIRVYGVLRKIQDYASQWRADRYEEINKDCRIYNREKKGGYDFIAYLLIKIHYEIAVFFSEILHDSDVPTYEDFYKTNLEFPAEKTNIKRYNLFYHTRAAQIAMAKNQSEKDSRKILDAIHDCAETTKTASSTYHPEEIIPLIQRFENYCTLKRLKVPFETDQLLDRDFINEVVKQKQVEFYEQIRQSPLLPGDSIEQIERENLPGIFYDSDLSVQGILHKFLYYNRLFFEKDPTTFLANLRSTVQSPSRKAEPEEPDTDTTQSKIYYFRYAKINTDPQRINIFFDALKKYKAIEQDLTLAQFKQIFSEENDQQPIKWLAQKNEISYLFKGLNRATLDGKKKLLEAPAGLSFWQVVCHCFVDADGQPFEEENLYKQKNPANVEALDKIIKKL